MTVEERANADEERRSMILPRETGSGWKGEGVVSTRSTLIPLRSNYDGDGRRRPRKGMTQGGLINRAGTRENESERAGRDDMSGESESGRSVAR